jgi:hypothetical protein
MISRKVVGTVKYGGHVRIVRIGGKFSAGLERYCDNVGSRNNVIFIPKPQMKKDFRTKALSWKSIRDEMFASGSYGRILEDKELRKDIPFGDVLSD